MSTTIVAKVRVGEVRYTGPGAGGTTVPTLLSALRCRRHLLHVHSSHQVRLGHIQNVTILPYFGVKLSCVSLMFA